MFRCLLHLLQRELLCMLETIVTEGSAKSAETCRRQVVINTCVLLCMFIVLVCCVCVLCWCVVYVYCMVCCVCVLCWCVVYVYCVGVLCMCIVLVCCVCVLCWCV